MASFLSFLFGNAQKDSIHVKILEKEAFLEAISKDSFQLVDVRTAKEFEAGHIDGAVNIDFFEKEAFFVKFEAMNKEQPIYIYCRSGNRSQKAAKRLVQMGFEEIFDLKGGYLNWKE